MKTPGYGSNCEASCVGSCGREWKANGNHCYYFSRGKQSWFDAEKFCQRNRGHLASVTDVQSHNFLKGKNTETWIGGVREPGNTTWVWTDCSPWNFTRWAGGEPKNELDKEGCLLRTYDNQWSEQLCTDKRRFVCSATVCSGTTTLKSENLERNLQMMFPPYKRLTAAQMSAHHTVLLAGKSSTAGATSGARRSSSGGRRSSSVRVLGDILPRSHPMTWTISCISM